MHFFAFVCITMHALLPWSLFCLKTRATLSPHEKCQHISRTIFSVPFGNRVPRLGPIRSHFSPPLIGLKTCANLAQPKPQEQFNYGKESSISERPAIDDETLHCSAFDQGRSSVSTQSALNYQSSTINRLPPSPGRNSSRLQRLHGLFPTRPWPLPSGRR